MMKHGMDFRKRHIHHHSTTAAQDTFKHTTKHRSHFDRFKLKDFKKCYFRRKNKGGNIIFVMPYPLVDTKDLLVPTL